MPAKVVDASALAALLFGEPDGAKIAKRLEGARLIAPSLLPYELANTCLVKVRRHSAQREAILAAHGLLRNLALDVLEVDFDEVLGLAEETGLSAHDASYLWLARSLDAELVTLDKRLAAHLAIR
jgi:predicted nucleic acid-binding protein